MSERLVPFLILSLIQAFLAHRGGKGEGRDEEVEIEKSEASWKEQAADERERLREGTRCGQSGARARRNNGQTSVWDYCPGFRGDIIICCTACQKEWDKGAVFSDAPVRDRWGEGDD